MFNCRVSKQEYPADGEIVVAETVSLEDDILRMKLIEYGDIQGMVLNNELSKRRIRSIHQITRVGSTEVCQVIRVHPEKGHIDLSLKRPSETERHACLDRFSRNKLAYQIMAKTAKISGVPVGQLYDEFGYDKMEEYGSLYGFFSRIKSSTEIHKSLPYGKIIKKVIDEQFKASKYKVRIDIDVTAAIGGVELIKQAFEQAIENDKEVEACLLRAPTYSITHVGTEKTATINLLNQIANKIEAFIRTNGGTFTVVVPPTVYGEKQKHALLDDQDASVLVSLEDESSDESA